MTLIINPGSRIGEPGNGWTNTEATARAEAERWLTGMHADGMTDVELLDGSTEREGRWVFTFRHAVTGTVGTGDHGIDDIGPTRRSTSSPRDLLERVKHARARSLSTSPRPASWPSARSGSVRRRGDPEHRQRRLPFLIGAPGLFADLVQVHALFLVRAAIACWPAMIPGLHCVVVRAYRTSRHPSRAGPRPGRTGKRRRRRILGLSYILFSAGPKHSQ